MIPSDATLRGSFPFAPHFTDAAGFPMHYVEEGARDGDVALCLHGEPTHRVLVPDHMGFGKSATPPDRSYWLQDHIDNLERFVLALDLSDITLVMHDFGGPVGMGLAARRPIVGDEWLAAYAAHFASPAHCLGAIGWAKGVAIGAHRFGTPDAAAIRAIGDRPALGIWGEADRTRRAEHFLPLFSELFPTAPVRRLSGVGHYCLEDAPDAVASLVIRFVDET